MMNFDFDSQVNRLGSGSYKWDSHEESDVLPMWVADMDFRTAPPIIEALRRRVEHGVFGYTYVPDEYYDSVIRWFGDRHGWDIKREWFIYTSGVVPALSAIIKALAEPGDKVIAQTPAYNCFFSSIRNNGCELAPNDLIYHDGTYTIDYNNLEMLASDPKAKILLLCNPHNPSGRVWTPEELRRIGEICMRHGVTVVADEIHCELVYPPHRYTPYGSLGEEYRATSVSCVSPSKAFNTAGLQIADIITANDSMRRRIDRAININEVCDVNPFGVVATIAAYNEGLPWLNALNEYLYGNYCMLVDELGRNVPFVRVVPLEGTYLAWIDVKSTGTPCETICDMLLRDEHLRLNPGTMYGSGGEGFLRLNLAAPRSVVADAVSRLIRLLTKIAPHQQF